MLKEGPNFAEYKEGKDKLEVECKGEKGNKGNKEGSRAPRAKGRKGRMPRPPAPKPEARALPWTRG